MGKFLLIIILLLAWIFSGYPPIWQNPRIPPKIQEAKAANTGYNPAAGNVEGGWVTETNAYTDDTNNATLIGTTGTSQWTTFGLDSEIPAGATISAVVVHIQCESNAVQGKKGDLTDIELSWDGGTSWTNTANTQSDCGDFDTDYYFPSTSGDLWGRGSWAVSDFSDANFQVKVSGDASEKATIELGIDIIQVKVFFAAPANLTWATEAADFSIYPASSGILIWNDITDGAAVCTATLTDDNAGDPVSCSSGSIANSTQYRVQVVLKNIGGESIDMQGSSEYVDHVAVKAGWAGTNPTLGVCGFNDVDGDDNSVACNAGWNATNDVRITQTNEGATCYFDATCLIINNNGTEGFMYLITTDNDVPSSNSTSYMNSSIDSITEDSSKITISGPAGGTITTDIVNASYVSVGSPTMAMNTATFSFPCQTVTGSFGTASEQIYVNNDGGANDGWTLTLAAQATTNVWDSAGTDYDFNDPTDSGCTDGTDAGDSVGGQMTIDPSGATLAVGQCGACTTNNVSKGSSAAFNEGTTDTITLLSATAASDDVGDWTLQGVSISQKIPAEQPAANDYDINMVLTVTAN